MTTSSAGKGTAFSWRFSAPLFMGSALNPVNSSLIATALVPIARSLHVSVGQTSVLVAVLYLASSVAQPTAGKLAEEFGPRRIFLIGILLVLAGGLVGGFAPNLSVLVVARVLIGVGTSAGYPTAMVLVRRRAEWAGMERPPGGVLGGLSIAGQVTAAVGLPIGGFLVAWLGWQSTFFINVPFAVVALVMALIWIPKDARAAESRSVGDFVSRIDLTGILGFAAMMTTLLVFLLSLPNPAWLFLIVAIVIGVALVFWELRAKNPFLDVRLLVTNLVLTRTYLRIGLTLLVVYTVMYGLTQWLEAGHGFTSSQAGLLVLPMTALAAIVSIPVSRRHLVRGPLLFAAGAALAGSVGMLFMTTSTSIFLIIGVTLVFGVTIGTTAVGNQTALYEAAPPSQLGTAAGLFRTFGYIGSIASSAIIGGVFRTSVDDNGLHTIAVILISISVIVLLMTLLDRRLKSPTKTATAATPNQRNSMPDNLPPIEPTKTALLIMDAQASVTGNVPNRNEVLGQLAETIATAREHGVHIGYVRVAFDDDDYEQIKPANKALGRLAGMAAHRPMHKDDQSTAVHDEVAPQEGDIVVRKTRIGAFSTTDLEEQLQANGITTLVLAGFTTSGVVLSTLRDAIDRDYGVFVLSDGSADSQADVHTMLTEKVFPTHAHVVTAEEFVALLP